MSESLAELVRPAITTAAPNGLGAKIEALPPRGMVTVRGDFADAAFAAGVKASVGLGVPETRRADVDSGHGVLWMSPDELLLWMPYAEAEAAVQSFDEATEGTHALAVNVSDARVVFRVSGAKARQILSKGAPVDLTPMAFGIGDYRRTRIGLVAAAFVMTDDAPDTFEIVCFRSYAEYVWHWLHDAARAESLFDL